MAQHGEQDGFHSVSLFCWLRACVVVLCVFLYYVRSYHQPAVRLYPIYIATLPTVRIDKRCHDVV